MRPERAPEQGSERARCFCYNPGFERDVWRRNTRSLRAQPFRSPLQGESLLEPDPGLKPWAILLCHFVAITASPFRPFAVSLPNPLEINILRFFQRPLAVSVPLSYY